MYRILFVQQYPGLGGPAYSLLYLIEKLDKSKYIPEVLFTSGGGDAISLYRKNNIVTHVRDDISFYPHALDGWLSLRSLRPWQIITWAIRIIPSAHRMRRFLDQNHYDLVHINTSTQIPAAMGAKWANVPVVWHIREILHPGYLGLRRLIIRAIIARYADVIIAISQANAQPLKPGSKLHVIYNFIDFEKFNRQLTGRAFRESLGIDAERPLVGMLGGIVSRKGADIFAEAALMIHDVRPDVIFLIAGMPPQGESPSPWKRMVRRMIERVLSIPNIEKRVQRLVAAHHLEESVRFIGIRQDIPEMLAALKVLVWPAKVSHFARPIIEAGAMGRPVIASDFPSSKELVDEGKNGLLIAPDSASELAKAILYILDHPQEAQQMGEEGYRRARERYDANQNTMAIIKLYEQMLTR